MDASKSLAAEQSLISGNVAEALAKLQEKIRSDPSNPKLRVFLFQLLSVTGDWDRALTQLNVAAEMDAGNLAMAQVYREALKCEALRTDVFAGRRSPLVFGEPENWIALLFESLRVAGEGRAEAARDLRNRAFEAAPTTAGALDGQRFEWLADADTRIGPMLEAIVLGRYYWIPFHRIHKIQIEAPTDLRDFVWTAVHFTWANGGESVGLVPTRYPASEKSDDSAIRLARRTEWVDAGADCYCGLGQRMFATDAGEHALLDTRLIVLDTLAPAGTAAPEGQNG